MELMMILSIVTALTTIGYGVTVIKQKKKVSLKKVVLTSLSFFGVAIVGVFVFIAMGSPVMAAPADQLVNTPVSFGEGLKYLAAALSTGLATIGTGRAVGAAGASAIGAVSEDPALLGKTLIFVGMAEGIAIYGVIISILILFV